MDPILMQKFQSIKKSKKSKKPRLLDKFFLYTFIAFTCSIFCSIPFWFPYMFASVNDFLFIFVPKMGSILYSPKLLFIVGNLIVVVLFGESKFFASEFSASGDLIYDENVDRSRSFEKSSTSLVLKKVTKMKPGEENVKMGSLVEEIISVKKENNNLQEEHEISLPTDELKKRADDFIARVNRQRRLEARMTRSKIMGCLV